MASKALKGLTIQIGADTSELNKALDSVDKKSRSLSSELSQINKLLKLDPQNVELLAQKQKVLTEAIGNTEARLKTLREAERQAQEQFAKGEISEAQYRALQREVIATEKKLDGYKRAAEETAESVEHLGDESKKAAVGIERTAEEAAEASDEVEELDVSLADVAKNGFTALAAAATAAMGAIFATAEASREYRTEMGKLTTAFRDANFSAEVAYETYSTLQGVIGETDQAVEATNHLAKLCDTEEDLAKWTDILTGVYGTFGASLSIESLTEAANETAKVGTLTGSLADAINWAAAEGETFGVTLRANTKKNKEWNEAVKEAASAEDYFNLALQECNSEQERQQLITQTLTRLYKGAAEQYRATNKEVIRANEAAEKWNRAIADIGEEMEPVVTDIKEMGTALLKEAKEPMKAVADFVRQKLLPMLTNLSKWALKNLPTIGTLIASVAATTVLYKAAALSAEMATKGLTVATLLQQKAQKALNLVMNANPYVLMATAVVAVATAVVALNAVMKEATAAADPLTEAEREIMTAAEEAAAAFREQKKATEEAFGSISSEMGYVQDLSNELSTLADESGEVAEKDRARADFIIGQLNEALGLEIQMVDGVILKYDELKGSIDEVIKSKTANSLLEAANADYVAALQNEVEAWNSKELALKEYLARQEEVKKKEEEYQEWREEYSRAVQSGNATGTDYAQIMMNSARTELEAAKGLLDEAESELDGAQSTYEEYQTTILNYEKAQEDALSGNYQTAIDIFSRKGELYTTHTETVEEETAKEVAALKKGVEDAYIKAKETRDNFEKGVSGYTAEMVREAERGYNTALSKFQTAYTEAYGVGQDFGQGLADGIKIKNGAVGAAAIAQIREAVKEAKLEAEIHSPSKKTEEIGRFLSEGTEIGLEKKTKDLEQAAARQMNALLDAYREPEVRAQRDFRSLAEQQTAHHFAGQMSAASATSPMLEKILSAIEKGQVLLLDGEALVGATASRMDNALGRRRDLAAKGAI